METKWRMRAIEKAWTAERLHAIHYKGAGGGDRWACRAMAESSIIVNIGHPSGASTGRSNTMSVFKL